MTIANTTNKTTYLAGTTLPYVGKIFLDTDLIVIKINLTTLVETPMVLTVDYNVTGAGGPGGNVVLTGAFPAGCSILIKNVQPITQGTDYTEGGSFPAESHENALDKLTMICQQLQEEVTRCIIFSAGSSYAGWNMPAPEALKLLRFNAAATALECVDFTGVSIGDLTTNQATKVTMTGDMAITDHGYAWPYTYIFDPNGADRLLNPGVFRPYTRVEIENIGIDFNVTINAASYPYVGPGESGRLIYDGTYWTKSST